MPELREGRVVKRSSNANSHEPAKRQRAPYALRACDACRRRKGKCDGAQPCGHCAGRGQGCSYSTSLASDEWWLATVASDAAGDRGEQTQNLRASKRASSITSSSNTNTQEAIMEMMSNLQGQLDSLASHVRSSGQNSNAQPANPNNSGSVGEGSTPSNETEATLSEHLVRRASQHFYGPTSPEYSLNVAQIKLRQMTSSGTPLQKQHLQLASIDDDAVSDHEDSNEIDQSTPAGSPQNRDRGEKTRLMRFRSLMSLQEAVRLLFVYQEVVGEFHPIIDIDKIMARLRSCYADVDPALWDCSPGRSGSTTGDEEILILNLALAIALRAEAKSSTHEMEGQIRESFEDSVNSRIAAPVTSLNAVTITLLKGFYDFFYDMIRSSWRMCGIAGRMLMELGLHNGDQSKFVVDSESQRTDVSTLVCSIVILDRQWSASTGLPKNFQDSHFDPLPKASIKNPYLKAMLSFILISDKFNEPISQAAKGEKYNDDDAFEVMNFQIEQWRKKSVGAHCLTQVDSWASDPSTRPPSWAILLTLRAMSIRSLLLKPSFFSQHDTEASRKCLRPAIEIASTMINALYTLDTTTDIYRKQHPYYQHLLASASALAFLIVASMEQNRHTRGVSLPPDLIETLNRTTEMAITLAANYAKTSRASRRLLKKLSEMRGSLIGLGITQTPATLSQEKRQPQRREQEASLANTSRAVQRKALPQQQALVPSGSFEFRAEFTQPFDVSTTAPAFTGSMAPLSDFDLQSGGWAESLWFHWPLGADSSMFPEPGT